MFFATALEAHTPYPSPEAACPCRIPFPLPTLELKAGFETNPIYWLMHESIYCDGVKGGASAWSAERVQSELGDAWDYTTRLEEGEHILCYRIL